MLTTTNIQIETLRNVGQTALYTACIVKIFFSILFEQTGVPLFYLLSDFYLLGTLSISIVAILGIQRICPAPFAIDLCHELFRRLYPL